MKAVSCESFALMMIGLFKESHAIQAEVLRSHKSDLSDKKSKELAVDHAVRYDYFYESVMKSINSVKYGIRLTLEFLIKYEQRSDKKDDFM